MAKKDKNNKKKSKKWLFALIPVGCLGVIGAVVLAIIAIILVIAIVIAAVFGFSLFTKGSADGSSDNTENLWGDTIPIESFSNNDTYLPYETGVYDPPTTHPSELPTDQPDETEFTTPAEIPTETESSSSDTPIYEVNGSKHLSYSDNGDGTCTVIGVGDCMDAKIIIPPRNEAGLDVVAIEDNAFSGLDTVTLIEIPDSVKSIGVYAFAECSNLREVTLPNSITTIPAFAFNKCYSLRRISLPSGITSIENDAFALCSDISEIDLPEGLERIGDSAFRECQSLLTINLPTSLEHIGSYAFWGCSGLRTFNTSPDGNLFSIGNEAFANCHQLQEFAIYPTVKDIGSGIFKDCYDLGNVTFRAETDKIPDNMFSGCSHLTSFEIPNNIEIIGNEAFYNCSSLMSLTLPSGLHTVGDNAFAGCDTIYTINNRSALALEEGSSAYGGVAMNASYIFSSDEDLTVEYYTVQFNYLSVVRSDGVAILLKYTGNESTPTLPTSIEGYNEYSIYKKAFKDRTTINTLIIPDNVTYIGDRAFEGCTGIRRVTIPDSVTGHGEFVFWNCAGIYQITQPEGMDILGIDAQMWDIENSIVVHQSFDSLKKNSKNGEDIFTVGSSDSWDKAAVVGTGDFSLIYSGWIGVRGELGTISYRIDDDIPEFSESSLLASDDSILESAVNLGADNAAYINIDIRIKGLSKGDHTVKVYYADKNGNAVLLNEFTVIVQ